MATIVANTVTQPSKASKLAYIIFGYTLAFSCFSLAQFGSSEEYLVYVAIVGGFVGTFFFFFKPIQRLFNFHYRRKSSGDDLRIFVFSSSPYLAESKEKIIRGFYFFFSCLIIAFLNANFYALSTENISIMRLLLTIIGLTVLIISLGEWKQLTPKIMIVNFYYALIEGKDIPGVHITVINQIRTALDKADWREAGIIVDKELEKM